MLLCNFIGTAFVFFITFGVETDVSAVKHYVDGNHGNISEVEPYGECQISGLCECDKFAGKTEKIADNYNEFKDYTFALCCSGFV